MDALVLIVDLALEIFCKTGTSVLISIATISTLQQCHMCQYGTCADMQKGSAQPPGPGRDIRHICACAGDFYAHAQMKSVGTSTPALSPRMRRRPSSCTNVSQGCGRCILCVLPPVTAMQKCTQAFRVFLLHNPPVHCTVPHVFAAGLFFSGNIGECNSGNPSTECM